MTLVQPALAFMASAWPDTGTDADTDGTTTPPTALVVASGRPSRSASRAARFGPTPSLNSQPDYDHLKRRRTQQTRPGAYRPFAMVPIELIERILSFVPLPDLCRCKRLDRSFRALLSHAHLYPILSLSSPPLPPSLAALLPQILPGARSLTLRSYPHPALATFLPSLSTRLTYLDLSFSGVTDNLLQLAVGADVAAGVRELSVKGCRGVRDGRALASHFSHAIRVDLSWSAVHDLPSPCSRLCPTSSSHSSSSSSDRDSDSDDSGFFDADSFTLIPDPTLWPDLVHLTLSSCPFLSSPPRYHSQSTSLEPETPLAAFLMHLPPLLQSLDLSHLRLPYTDLCGLNFARSEAGGTTLELSLVGNDLLTRSAIARLDRTWCARLGKRRQVKVEHNAVLESESEEDVRRFVELVAGGSR